MSLILVLCYTTPGEPFIMPQLEDPDFHGGIVYPQYYTIPYPKYFPNGISHW